MSWTRTSTDKIDAVVDGSRHMQSNEMTDFNVLPWSEKVTAW